MEQENGKVLLAAAAVAALAAGGWYAWNASRAPAPAPAISSTAPEAPPPVPADLPKLEESDEAVRREAAALSSDAAFASWLKSDDLLQRFVSAVVQISRGQTPREALAALAPRGKFSVLKKDGRASADPRSFARYDSVAAAVASIDAARAAALFKRFEPLLDQARRSLGDGAGGVRADLGAAIAELTAVAVPDEAPELKPAKKGIVWAYADEGLEKLGPARKQLLRMGPKNAAKIQAKLRELALALGLPSR